MTKEKQYEVKVWAKQGLLLFIRQKNMYNEQ